MNDTEDRRRWNVASESGMLDYYDANVEIAYRCAARLTRGDRAQAEDLVHDAFTQLVRSALDGRTDDIGTGWIVSVVRRRFVDRLRSSEREARRLHLVAPDVAQPAPAVAERLDTTAMLDELAPRERAALVLRYVEDLPVPHVAELLGTTVRATESLLQRAKRKARRSEDAS